MPLRASIFACSARHSAAQLNYIVILRLAEESRRTAAELLRKTKSRELFDGSRLIGFLLREYYFFDLEEDWLFALFLALIAF